MVDESRKKIIYSWLIKADEDVYTAQKLLRGEGYIPVSVVCFHCQQGAEKYLKGLLVFRNIDFRKSHDLLYLLNLLKDHSLGFYLLTAMMFSS